MNNSYPNNPNPGDNSRIQPMQSYPPQNTYNNMGKLSGNMDINNNNPEMDNSVILPMNKRMKMYDKDNISDSYSDIDNKGIYIYISFFFFFFFLKIKFNIFLFF